MYPSSHKSALVKKEMRDLREIVGDDSDVEQLFEAAMKTNVPRVVVKRHRHALPINDSTPTHVILTKLLRFDVYLKKL
jgi:16S rRNA (guanine1516-N2)-methyltransferase